MRRIKSSGVAGCCVDERAAGRADSDVGERAGGGVAAGVVAVDLAEVSIMRLARLGARLQNNYGLRKL